MGTITRYAFVLALLCNIFAHLPPASDGKLVEVGDNVTTSITGDKHEQRFTRVDRNLL